MSEVKGLLFVNGVQALATVIKEDENFLYVENMLALQMTPPTLDEHGNEIGPAKVYFDDFTSFAELTKTGLDTKIPWSSIMFPFQPEARILIGYKNRTSLIALS